MQPLQRLLRKDNPTPIWYLSLHWKGSMPLASERWKGEICNQVCLVTLGQGPSIWKVVMKENDNRAEMNENADNQGNEKKMVITRKEALKKAGKYAAFTASSMIYLLSSQEARAGSQEPELPGGF